VSVAGRLKRLARNAVRTGYWVWSRRLDTATAALSRSDYKATWHALSQRESDAKMFVASDVDEAAFATSADLTLATLDEFVGVRPDDVVLEIGCGVGRVGRVVAPRCREWIGTDISAHMLRHAAARLADLPNVRFVELPTVGLDGIPDASIDLVYCTVVFMHLYEWDRYRYVQEAVRVLRSGGRCYFDNIDISSSHGWKVFHDAASYPIDQRPPYLPMTSSAPELETYGRHAGLTNVTVRRWADAWVALTGAKP
jgi:SAM-dependent methyltransferase